MKKLMVVVLFGLVACGGAKKTPTGPIAEGGACDLAGTWQLTTTWEGELPEACAAAADVPWDQPVDATITFTEGEGHLVSGTPWGEGGTVSMGRIGVEPEGCSMTLGMSNEGRGEPLVEAEYTLKVTGTTGTGTVSLTRADPNASDSGANPCIRNGNVTATKQ